MNAPLFLPVYALPEPEPYAAFSADKGTRKEWLQLRRRDGLCTMLRFPDLREIAHTRRDSRYSVGVIHLTFFYCTFVTVRGMYLTPVLKAIYNYECIYLTEVGAVQPEPGAPVIYDIGIQRPDA